MSSPPRWIEVKVVLTLSASAITRTPLHPILLPAVFMRARGKNMLIVAGNGVPKKKTYDTDAAQSK